MEKSDQYLSRLLLQLHCHVLVSVRSLKASLRNASTHYAHLATHKAPLKPASLAGVCPCVSVCVCVGLIVLHSGYVLRQTSISHVACEKKTFHLRCMLGRIRVKCNGLSGPEGLTGTDGGFGLGHGCRSDMPIVFFPSV